MFNHLVRAAVCLVVLAPKIADAQTATPAKLDETLRETVQRGCFGTRSVIIRTTPGYRQGLRASLTAHGDVVSGEFPALDAIAATVHCSDLPTLAGFSSTRSVSTNAPVAGQLLPTDRDLLATATSTLQAARTALDAARLEQDSARDALSKATIAVQKAADKVKNTKPQSPVAVRNRSDEGKAAGDLQQTIFRTLGVRTNIDSLGMPVTDHTPAKKASPLQGTGVSDGSGVGVAVIDSGIEATDDFGDRITAFYDFTGGAIQAVPPSDAYGHGTHVAGLIASRYVGVAPNARLIGLKVLDGRGQGTTDNVVRAIEFAIANKSVLDIQVINLSLGHPIYEPAASDPLVQAVEHAVRSGLDVVVSVGNFGISPVTHAVGYAGVVSPANAPSAISVGATRTFDTDDRSDDRIAPYSSRGPSWYDGFAKPDISAPGDNLLSLAATGSRLRLAQEARGNSGNYMRLSGTSMAAAVTSGLVALVLQNNRALTPNALKAVLEYSAIPVLDEHQRPYDALTQGAGDINGAGAVALARVIDPSVPVGRSWLTSRVAPTSVLANRSYAWSQEIIWGNHIGRGAGVLAEQRPAWSLDIVWGAGLDDDNIVWGNMLDDDNIVWGNSFDNGDNIVWGNNVVFGNMLDDDNIVWGNLFDDNVVWGNNLVWGDGLIGLCLDDDNIVWGNLLDDDNIVWGNLADDNVVWGNLFDDNVVWGNSGSNDVEDDSPSGGISIGVNATNSRARRTPSRVKGAR